MHPSDDIKGIKVNIDNSSPLGYGMPDEGSVLFYGSPAFRIRSGKNNDKYKTIVRYKDKNLLKSGWLLGEKTIAKKAGMVCAEYGEGKIVLIGFRTQHRCQTHGTFKLLFNTIIE